MFLVFLIVAPDRLSAEGCNSNGVLAGFDISAGRSHFCNAIESSGGGMLLGTAVQWAGPVDNVPTVWGRVENWSPNEVPDNSVQEQYDVTIKGSTSELTLDMSPTIVS